ncbi:hypothetical protein [Alcaligenes aquatilis]|uniref:Uncharacterized protein n=1 Tax=Alcaligenes aquatilis TaxID=323284 RepID=A0A3G2HUM9_9BURK|nr:hypothetical protein [Alcaligenes aquatilis]AYN20699.1 hypothetical protein D3M96_09280 [Alcaligenes aquatilis]
MHVDDTQFPLVFLREHSPQQTPQQAQDQLEALLNRGQRFVLLTDRMGGEDPAHEESHEDRKQRALFFKQNKPRLKELCAGMVVISKGRAIPAAVRLAQQTLGRVLGLRFAFVMDETQARMQARRLLEAGPVKEVEKIR